MSKILLSRSFWTVMVLVAFSTLAYKYAISSPNGITGQSKIGCTDFGCHHSTSASTSTKLTISGPDGPYQAGTAYTFRLVMHHPTAKQGGCNISVDGGSLALAGSGTGLFLSRKELTHSTPRSFTGDSVQWNFKWTAPATPGTYHIYAAGNAVNGNGRDDAGDEWNLASVTVTVGAAGPAPHIAMVEPKHPNVRVGSTGTFSITIRNTGDAALTISHYSLKKALVFQLLDSSAHTIAAHDSLHVTASFSPQARQPYTDSLIVFSNDAAQARATIPLIGSGIEGVLQVTPSPYDFGQVKLGDAKTTRIVIRNWGDDTLTVGALTAQATTEFTVQSIVPFVTLPAQFAPGDSVVMTILFQPTRVAKDTMILSVGLLQLDIAHDTSFAIYGEGVPSGAVSAAATPAFSLAPNPVANVLTIRTGAIPAQSYTIVDAKCAVVSHGEIDNASFTIDVSTLASGAYWLRLTTSTGEIGEQFVRK